MIATMGRTTSNCDLHTRPSDAFSQAISPRPTSFLIRDILGKGDPGSEESHHNVTCDARLSLSNEALDDDSDCYSPQTIGDRGTCKKENYQFEEGPSSQLNTPDGTFEAESNFDLTFDRSRISYCNAGELSTRYSDIKKLRLDQKYISRLHRHKSREEFRSDSSEKDFVSKNICLSESTASNSPFASRQLLKRVEKEEYSSETSGPQRSFLKRSDDDLHNGHPFIGNLLVSPANYPMLDLRYGYALGANGAVAMPHLSHMLLGYQNASLVSPNFSTVYNEYIERAKNLISSRTLLSTSIPHQGPRYTLKEPWVKENHISPHLQVHHHGTSPISEKRNFYPDSCDISSDQAPSPCSSSFSSATPPPKPAVHLPAYLRSRLSGANSSSDVETVGANGKPKKCRRSRTVFTELQMLGLEKRFEKQQYLSTPDRVELAELLGLSQLQVKTWYQNRRMKWKKQVLQGGGTEAPTKPKGRPRKIRPEDQANLGNKASQQLNLSKDQCVKSTSPLIINPVT